MTTTKRACAAVPRPPPCDLGCQDRGDGRSGHIVVDWDFFGRRSNSTPARSGLPRGFDEGDQISGDGSADLQNDGSIEIALSFDNGDDAVLIARRE
jgi:hypothetical protein